MSNTDKTLSIVKPDAVERNPAADIKNIFVKNNSTGSKRKKIHISKEAAAKIYKVLQARRF